MPVATVFGQNEAAAQKDKAPPADPKKDPVRKNYDDVGPQVGDQLPALNLRTTKGDPQRLSDAWRGGPALLVTSSLTCPRSRSRWPELKTIVDKYGDRLNVVIVYVIEAHPIESVCPYKGVEDVSPENQRDGLLRRQPAKVEDRIELALEFKRYLRVDAPIYVDTVDNRAWKAFGAAPNIAYFVDARGVVAARQSWFDGKTMERAIDKYFAANRPAPPNERPRGPSPKQSPGDAALRKAGISYYELRAMMRDENTDKLARLLKQAPVLAGYVFPSDPGHRGTMSCLMQAAKDRNVTAVKLLLSTGADVKARTSSFDSALQVAAGTGDLKIIKLLLENGADPNVPRTGDSPTHVAALAGHQDAVKLLIEAGAHGDFWSDVALGHLEELRKALTADPSLALRPDGAGRMPLDYAATNGQTEVATLLLAAGAPVVDESRVMMEPPLHRAIRHGHDRMVKLLLDAGSSADTAVLMGIDQAGSTPALHLAIRKEHADIVRTLLAHKADLKARDEFSMTPLHVAAQVSTEIVEILLRAGADVNALQLGFDLPCGSGEENTPSHNTPLHFAAACGNAATIKALLKAGAKLEARNVHGQTPLMSAVTPPLYTRIAEKSQLANIKALIDAKADVNARDKNGNTVLDAALEAMPLGGDEAANRQRMKDVVELLKKSGAKPGASKR